MRRMRPLLALATAAAALSVCSLAPGADAAACAAICSTKDVYGFTAGGVSNCLCNNGKSTPTCKCSQCYTIQSDGRVFTFAYGTDGKCEWGGADCLDCDSSSSSGNATTPTPTTASPTSAPTTLSPSPTSSSVNATAADGAGTGSPTTTAPSSTSPLAPSSGGNSSNSNSTATKAPTASGSDSAANASSDSSDGMQTWQIALIICCAALVFIVAAVALLSCYCKARRRLNESEDHDADATYYHQPFAAVGGPSGGSATRIAASASGTDYYDSNRQTYGKAAMGATPGSYSGSDSRYATALTSAENSPERISPGVSGGYASVGRPSSGSVGDASTPYGYDRRMSNQYSQAVTL